MELLPPLRIVTPADALTSGAEVFHKKPATAQYRPTAARDGVRVPCSLADTEKHRMGAYCLVLSDPSNASTMNVYLTGE
jgi:hypothetical protein